MDALEFHYVGLVGLANTFENRPAEFKRILYIKRGLKSELDHKNEGQVQILGRRSVSSYLVWDPDLPAGSYGTLTDRVIRVRPVVRKTMIDCQWTSSFPSPRTADTILIILYLCRPIVTNVCYGALPTCRRNHMIRTVLSSTQGPGIRQTSGMMGAGN